MKTQVDCMVRLIFLQTCVVGDGTTGIGKIKKDLFVILNASEESYTIDRSPLYLSRVYISRRRFFALLRMTKRVFPTPVVTTPTRATIT